MENLVMLLGLASLLILTCVVVFYVVLIAHYFLWRPLKNATKKWWEEFSGTGTPKDSKFTETFAHFWDEDLSKKIDAHAEKLAKEIIEKEEQKDKFAELQREVDLLGTYAEKTHQIDSKVAELDVTVFKLIDQIENIDAETKKLPKTPHVAALAKSAFHSYMMEINEKINRLEAAKDRHERQIERLLTDNTELSQKNMQLEKMAEIYRWGCGEDK